LLWVFLAFGLALYTLRFFSDFGLFRSARDLFFVLIDFCKIVEASGLSIDVLKMLKWWLIWFRLGILELLAVFAISFEIEPQNLEVGPLFSSSGEPGDNKSLGSVEAPLGGEVRGDCTFEGLPLTGELIISSSSSEYLSITSFISS